MKASVLPPITASAIRVRSSNLFREDLDGHRALTRKETRCFKENGFVKLSDVLTTETLELVKISSIARRAPGESVEDRARSWLRGEMKLSM